jgi:hypothetical protein
VGNDWRLRPERVREEEEPVNDKAGLDEESTAQAEESVEQVVVILLSTQEDVPEHQLQLGPAEKQVVQAENWVQS